MQDYYKEIKSAFEYQTLEEVKAFENKFLNDIKELTINTRMKFQTLKTQLLGEGAEIL